MLKESVETSLNPTTLTDYELLRFAEDFAYGNGLPKEFQIELVKRFALKTI